MKRWLIFGLFLILVNGSVFAADSTNLSQALAGGKQAISNISVNELELPSALTSATKVIFNIPAGENITLSYFVILVALFIFFLLLISSLMQFVPFFDGWKAWVGALVITLLVAFSGGIRASTQLFLNFEVNFGRFAQIGFVFIAVILIIIGWGLTKLLKMVKDKVGVETAEHMGENLSVRPLMAKLKEGRL